MLNLIQLLRQVLHDVVLATPARDAGAHPDDPFAHPALGRMTLRELADLPFPRPHPTQAARPADAPKRAAA